MTGHETTIGQTSTGKAARAAGLVGDATVSWAAAGLESALAGTHDPRPVGMPPHIHDQPEFVFEFGSAADRQRAGDAGILLDRDAIAQAVEQMGPNEFLYIVPVDDGHDG